MTIRHEYEITQKDREDILNQKGLVIWFTGLSGSGKSTISNALSKKLNELKFLTYNLDGDNIRQGLNKDLGFSDEDRVENIRRIAEVAKLFVDTGVITTTAFISPFENERREARKIIGPERFIEVYVSTPLEECIKRDPKGLYKKALNGEIKDFTGIDSEYQKPLAYDLEIDTTRVSIEEAIHTLMKLIKEKSKNISR